MSATGRRVVSCLDYVMNSSRVDWTDSEHADCGSCSLCESVTSADSALIINRHRVPDRQYQTRQWPPPLLCGPTAAVDQVPSPRDIPLSSSQRVVDCHAAVSAAGPVHYDVVRPSNTGCSSTVYSQSYGDTGRRSRMSAPSTAAIVQPYCRLDVNIGAPSPICKSAGKPSFSLPRPSTSMSTTPQYSHASTGTKTTRDVVQELGKQKLTLKRPSMSCPNLRLVSSADTQSQSGRVAVMSTFGKSRPAVQYHCTTHDCHDVHMQKIFGCEDTVYLGRRDVDLFGRVDAAHPACDAAGRGVVLGDRVGTTTRHSYVQSLYGTLQETALSSSSSSRAARMRAFLSSDRRGKQSSVACETTRLNSAVCKPIITATRHHKVSYLHTVSVLL